MPEVTIDEMEQASKAAEPAAKPTDLSSIRFDDSSVPEHLKGKTAAELVQMVERTRESLRLSEDARQALVNSAGRVGDPREERREEPVDESDSITRDQLAELFKDDPMKAMEIYEKRLLKNLGGHLNERFQPLVKGSIAQQQNQARSKYATEFELFADQINEVAEQVDPSVLTTAKGWEDIVSYVRGQPQNFEKLISRAANGGRTASDARREQIEDIGFSTGRSPRQEATSIDFMGLDEVQRKIAENQFPDLSPQKAYAEYKKWA